ncbi:MAG: amine oxidase [Burkholderiaceae bacterium]|nr:amine oxidase [Burkholderiaceae bacterium]
MNDSEKKIAIIIGAGPAGLTAALELLRRTNIKPIVLEADDCVGGISRTVNHHGNRIDIGGHRFFSKSEWVMNWWQKILPSQNVAPTDSDKVMLVRGRLSRIYYLRSFFDYPIKLSANTIGNLGLIRMVKIGLSYLSAMAFPRKSENTLEDFLINRFGKELFLTFFKDYTEKVWGVPCDQISAEWGAQRIKGLSIKAALKHALGKMFIKNSAKQAENTSLIEQFLYPKFGPGQMWEEVAQQVTKLGGEIRFQHKAHGVRIENGQIKSIRVLDTTNGSESEIPCEIAFSTMPVRDLVQAIGNVAPEDVRAIANDLPYRDFITVGLLVSKMKKNAQSQSIASNNMPPDNWIYIQESDVKVGRLQIFNNWSPWMVHDPQKVWMGLEYFCNEGDTLWNLSDDEMKRLGTSEMAQIGMIDPQDIEDSIVIRVPKAYPAYFGAYSQFETVRKYLNSISNLYLIGRNGMHRYNNQDHSMLTAKVAVDNIVGGVTDKSNIWAVNIDDEYHEEKSGK